MKLGGWLRLFLFVCGLWTTLFCVALFLMGNVRHMCDQHEEIKVDAAAMSKDEFMKWVRDSADPTKRPAQKITVASIWRVTGSLIVLWLAPVVVVFVMGAGIGWVARGFRNPALELI